VVWERIEVEAGADGEVSRPRREEQFAQVHQAEILASLGECFGAGGEDEAVAHDGVCVGKWDLSQF